jgi:hypothetical protein
MKLHHAKFLFRLDWPLFRPEAALTPDTRNLTPFTDYSALFTIRLSSLMRSSGKGFGSCVFNSSAAF